MGKKIENERGKAYRTIRSAIMFGTLKPGEKVVERRICDMLGLGRTPAREAIRQLESEGFLRVVPNRGAYVSKISINGMEEVAEVLGVLEGYGAAKAAQLIKPKQINTLKKIGAKVSTVAKKGNLELYSEADFAFHEFFSGLVGNAFLVGEIRKLRNKLFLLRALEKTLFDHVDEFLLDHMCIIEAISDRAPEKAREAARLHVQHAKDHFIQFLNNNAWFL